METLFGRYKIIYVSEDDLTRTHYVNDLFRRELQKGKLIELFSKNNKLNFVKLLIWDLKNIY